MTVADTTTTTPSCAFVTLVTTEPYVVGALVLAHSLRATTPSCQNCHLVCILTDAISQSSRTALLTVFDRCIEVPKLDTLDHRNLALLGRPELGQTLTKLHIWRLEEYQKAVFLDADMLIVGDVGELVERPELSACADVGWPDCFNSGLFVCEPKESTFQALMEHYRRFGSFDGGDQGLLNSFFDKWSTSGPAHRIPFTFNVTFTSSYGYMPALARFRDQVKAVHFIGADKPWLRLNHHGKANGANEEYIGKWWAVHDRHVRGLLNQSNRPAFSGYYNVPVRSQKSPSIDCDLASYRIKWSHEVEQYFAAKQTAAGSIIRKTTPVDDDLEPFPLYTSGKLKKKDYGADGLPTAFANKARI